MGKGKQISEDLRWVIVRMASVLTVDTIAVYTNVSRRQILRILSCYRRTGQVLKPDRTLKTGRKHHLSELELTVSETGLAMLQLADILQFLQNEVKGTCDAYLDELRKELVAVTGKPVSDSTVWRALRRSGYTMKKVCNIIANLLLPLAKTCTKLTKVAIERNELKREEFRQHMALSYLPDQLVFVDESACDRRTTYRERAWAIKGQRAVRKAFFIRGKRCVSSRYKVNLL